jgi:tRNA 2-thiouridine synthesizing protein A
MADQTLDAKGLNCPLPILRTKKTISSMPKDSVLEVLATDPGSVADIASFCRTTGNELLESTKDGDVFRFLIKHTA